MLFDPMIFNIKIVFRCFKQGYQCIQTGSESDFKYREGSIFKKCKAVFNKNMVCLLYGAMF